MLTVSITDYTVPWKHRDYDPLPEPDFTSTTLPTVGLTFEEIQGALRGNHGRLVGDWMPLPDGGKVGTFRKRHPTDPHKDWITVVKVWEG